MRTEEELKQLAIQNRTEALQIEKERVELLAKKDSNEKRSLELKSRELAAKRLEDSIIEEKKHVASMMKEGEIRANEKRFAA